MAVDLNHGLIWGRDLDLFYGNVRFDENEVEPIEIDDRCY